MSSTSPRAEIQDHLQVVEELAYETNSLMGIVQMIEGQRDGNLANLDRDGAARLLRTVSEKIQALSQRAQATGRNLQS